MTGHWWELHIDRYMHENGISFKSISPAFNSLKRTQPLLYILLLCVHKLENETEFKAK